jgi:glycosyltransferase involved in cell wall biosynthesis
VRAAAPQAELTGWQPAEAVARRLRHARALVFPSLWPETQGMAVSEAAALGVPAIVSDGCAAREAVEDGVTGLLFRSGDAADLRRQIERCRDDALVARMGRAAHARFWADPPTVDAHVRALVALYAQVLEDEGGHG